MDIRIAPSILSADFANLERDIAQVASADLLHVDVMDAHFVPNLTLGLPVVARICEVSPLPVDVHLMIDAPDEWAVRYAQAGAASVTFHLEATSDPAALADRIRSAGAHAAVALRPASTGDELLGLLDAFDMILVMTVEPGFGGQSFMPDMTAKVSRFRKAIDASGAPVSIQVDGGISRDTIATVVAAGADTLVAGSAIFGATDRTAEIAALRARAEAARRV